MFISKLLLQMNLHNGCRFYKLAGTINPLSLNSFSNEGGKISNGIQSMCELVHYNFLFFKLYLYSPVNYPIPSGPPKFGRKAAGALLQLKQFTNNQR